MLIVIVVLSALTPMLRQWVFGDDSSFVEYLWTYFVVFAPLLVLAFATRLVRFGWERGPD